LLEIDRGAVNPYHNHFQNIIIPAKFSKRRQSSPEIVYSDKVLREMPKVVSFLSLTRA
jgi:hypothetical protein